MRPWWAQARQRLRNWSGGKLADQKVRRLVESAKATAGVRQTEADVQRVRWCATEALVPARRPAAVAGS